MPDRSYLLLHILIVTLLQEQPVLPVLPARAPERAQPRVREPGPGPEPGPPSQPAFALLPSCSQQLRMIM